MADVFDDIEHYRIVARLGQGGLGRVYRAFDTRLERYVALKVLLPGGGGPDAAARLIREARAAAALDHPNAVHVYGVGSHEGAPYIAMELVRGQTLREKIATPTPLRTRLGWIVDVARALAAAHALGIVHRDVKPDNVMIREDGRVKVLDFGIARRLAVALDPSAPTEAATPTLTAKGAIVGTPAYMAPEQIRLQNVDARADQFAWGVTAYEVITGARPWAGDALSLVAAVVSDPAPPLREHVEALPDGVEAVVLRALEKRPDDRFATMNELVAALEPLTLEGAVASPASVKAMSPPATQPSGGARAALAALGAAAITAGATGLTEVITGARKSAAPQPPPKSSLRRRVLRGLAGVLAVAAAVRFGLTSLERYANQAEESPSPSASGSADVVLRTGGAVLPPGTQPVAARAYTDAIALWRTRSEHLALAELDHAIAADPSLAAAQLRYALFSFGEDPSGGREHLQKAEQERAHLDAHDAALLDVALAYMSEPPDLAGFEARVTALSARDPNDVEALYWLALAQRLRGRVPDAKATLARALAVDPGFAPAAALLGVLQLLEEGDFDGALATTEACLARAPNAALCIGNKIMILTARGRCAENEAVARKWAATMPQHPGGFSALATTLDALDRPVERVEEWLRAMSERLRPSQRAEADTWNRAKLAMAHGGFDDAERALHEAERLAASRPELTVRAGVTSMLAHLYLEEGRPRDAGAVAERLLKRESALSRTTLPTWQGISFDPTLGLASIGAHFGSLPKEELERRRAAWLAEQEKAIAGRKTPGIRGALWVNAFAMTAETADEAKAALALLPDYGGSFPPVIEAYPDALADVGRVRLLAGEADAAVKVLRLVVANCDILERPLTIVRAREQLGEALEQMGDKAGARDAYRAVLARWGSAKPKSVTAERARSRLKALGN